MSDPTEYTLLMASLPRHGSLFTAKRPPINRIKLEARLRALRPEHREILLLVEDAVMWYRLPLGLEDEDIVARGRRALSAIESETLRLIVRDRLELRTCLAALRRRQAGERAPPRGTAWGFGRWVGQMTRHWRERSFRLERVLPWLREADRLMREGETLALERLLLELLWRGLGRHAGEHEFDFEAVVIYRLRWQLIDRWTRYSAAAARERFAEMTQEALGAYAAMPLEEARWPGA